MPSGVDRILPAAVALLLAAGAVGRAEAQATRDFRSNVRLGIGYSGALPNAVAGAGAFVLLGQSRIGFFADAKMTQPRLSQHHNFCPPALGECNVSWVSANRNDYHARDEDEWLVFNGGVMYALTNEFAVMLGGGMARREGVREYVHDEPDVEARITLEGTYFVPLNTDPEWTAQAVIGALIRATNRVAFSVGHETGPGGLTVGLYFMH